MKHRNFSNLKLLLDFIFMMNDDIKQEARSDNGNTAQGTCRYQTED